MTARNVTRKSKALQDILTKTRFKSWLDGKGPDICVGSVPNPFVCPITKYVSEMIKPDAIRTTKATIYCTVSGVEVREPLPVWARGFITRIDLGGARSVTAKEALDHL